MTLSSSIKINFATSQSSTEQESTIAISSNADYSTRVSESNASYYEYSGSAETTRKDINVYSGSDLIGVTLGMNKVIGLHITNEGTTPIKVDGTYTTLPIVYGDVVIPGQGCLAVHSVYGYNVVYGASDVVSINPYTGFASYIVRIIGTR